MEEQNQQIETRLSKLEKKTQGGVRFFVQYLLSPFLVVAIGVVVNWNIEQDRKEVQQIKVAQSMLSTLFSEDEFQIMATKRLMDEVLQDESLKIEIGKIVNDYMISKFNALANEGDYENAVKVHTAVESIGGNAGSEIAKNIEANKDSKSIFYNYEIAKRNEKEGFSALVREDYVVAIEKFKKAYEVYPQYHSVSEIYKLLKNNKDKLTEHTTKRRVIKKILNDYSWKAPQGSISILRSQ